MRPGWPHCTAEPGLDAAELALVENGRIDEVSTGGLRKLQAAYGDTFRASVKDEKLKTAPEHVATETMAMCAINIKDGGIAPTG